jgi:hypothetical protein
MTTAAHPHALSVNKTWVRWTGRVFSAIPVLMMTMSAGMKLFGGAMVEPTFVGKFGYQAPALPVIALVELSCAALYLVPRTAVLGAILVTGYLGGAVATHVRVGDVFIAPLLLGVVAWAGLYLRDERLQDLIPLRRKSISAEG